MEKFIERLVFFDRGKDTNLIFGALIVAIVADMRFSALVINRPIWIYFPLIFILLSFVYYFFRKIKTAKEAAENPKIISRGKGIKAKRRKKRVKKKKRVRKIDFNMSALDKAKLLTPWIVTISILYYFSISALFSLSSTFYAKDNRIERFNCRIIDLHKYKRRNYIYYEFMGSRYSFKLADDTLEDLEKDDKYKKNNLLLNVKKGLANSYVIENWDLEPL